ncbi:hypothetical protein HGRIS_006024 [Hohenbuehelia grisea]|uniref:Uncharacterized protein n=1 Tax=Hohenbuehelia grisea TaxID=104357 RepID=A0ABR3JZP8_9AGAR
MTAFERVPSNLRERLARFTDGQTRLIGGSSDTVYIPGKSRDAFMDVLALFLETNCFLEIAVPTALHLVVPPNEDILFVDHWWIWEPPFNAQFVRQKWEAGLEVDTFHTFHWGEKGADGVWKGNHSHVADERIFRIFPWHFDNIILDVAFDGRYPQREVLQTALATDDLRGSLAACVNSLQRTAHLGDESTSFDTNSPFDALRVTFAQLLPDHQRAHSSLLSSYLARPGRLTRIWPKIVFLPPLVLFAVRALYNRKSSLAELHEEAKETVHGFVRGWILDPLADIVRTVRAGSDEDAAGIIIRKEGVKADLDSLERMAVSLAQDKLAYTPAQVDALRTQIAAGDLTPVLEIYEADIRTPLRSALTGTLLRSVFIQVQKAKVDIDQALTGIDKLIKSQELTFAFVGVAPALVVAYVLGGYLRTALSGTAARLGLPGAQRHQDRYGGRTERARVAVVMRRVERLLVQQGAKSGVAGVGEVTPLTHGLLLVSLAHLRAYAVQWLRAHKGFLREDGPGIGLGLIGTSPDVEPSSSTGVPASLVQEDSEPEEAEEVRDEGEEGANGGGDEYTGGDTGMREGFLEDVGDLEDPRLAREDRLRVVDRMWRCWGARLGWGVGGA